VPQDGPRRSDAIDELLTLGTFAAIAATASGAGIAFKAEKVGPYLAVITYTSAAATEVNFWTLSIVGADNSSYTNPVVLASAVLSGGAAPKKAYLALEGAAVASLMDAAGEGEAIYIRATATEAGTAAALTGKVYLTCE
jgi:hypothetical protein